MTVNQKQACACCINSVKIFFAYKEPCTSFIEGRISKPIFYLLRNIYDGVNELVAIVDTSKCTGCETCVNECPASAIAVENEKAKVDKEMCVDCQTCVDVCPSEAIAME
jgi:Pyruvate/2-oxoacid:ferredoxin oxidoreductase delta subunit